MRSRHARAALLAKQEFRGLLVSASVQADSILEIGIYPAQMDSRPGERPQRADRQTPPPINCPMAVETCTRVQGGSFRHRQGYSRLKLMGDDPNAPHMLARAAKDGSPDWGAEAATASRNFSSPVWGRFSYDACPSIPPGSRLLPKWFYFNLYHVSAWTRTMILPLGIVVTLRYTRAILNHLRIDELYWITPPPNRVAEPARGLPRSWRDVFLRVDRVLKVYEESPIGLLRDKAMRQAEQWLLEHSRRIGRPRRDFSADGLHPDRVPCARYPDDHPRVAAAHKHLQEFFIRDGDEIRIQHASPPCGIPARAARAGGSRSDTGNRAGETRDAMAAGEKNAAWLRIGRRIAPASSRPGGSSSFRIRITPTSTTLRWSRWRCIAPAADSARARGEARRRLAAGDAKRRRGWAAFDRTKRSADSREDSFADHNAMQDPSCPDIAGRVLECLGHIVFTTAHPAVQRAVRYIRSQQDASGGSVGSLGR